MSAPTHAHDLRAELHDLLRARGGRLTPARRAVLDVLLDAGHDHLSAEEVVERVAERDPAVHRASVHRTLDLFVSLGLVQHVHPGHGPARYHLQGAHGPHLHLQCRECGRLFDLPLDLMTGLQQSLADAGFQLDPGHVALSGTCPQCLANPDR